MSSLTFSTISILDYASLVLLSLAFIFSLRAIQVRTLSATKKYRVTLIALNILAFVALLGLILNPKYKTEIPLEIKLFTNNISEDFSEIDLGANSINYFLSKTSKFNSKYESELGDKINRHAINIQPLRTPEQILLKHQGLSEITILGDGLNQYQWDKLPNLKINYKPPRLIKGIIQPHWVPTISLGDTTNFTGRLQVSSSDIYQLKITDPAGEIIAQQKLLNGEYFKLEIKPKLVGFHHYIVLLSDSNDNLVEKNTINIQVTPAKAAKILVIQSAPSFETKQLQNWAAENGSQFSIRTQISKDKYITRSSNISSIHLALINQENLSSELFEYFDLVIIDGRELANLKDSETTLLLRNVEKGLGLLVLVDHDLLAISENKQLKLLENFQITPLNQETKTIPYFISSEQDATPMSDQFVPLSAASISFKNINTSQPLIKSSNGAAIAVSQSKQLGNLSVSLLQSTHQLITSGYRSDYTNLWQLLIKSSARKNRISTIQLKSDNHLLLENSLAQLCYIKTNESNELVSHLLILDDITSTNISEHKDSSLAQKLTIKENALIADRACGSFWAKSAGWYQVFKPDSNTRLESFYVLPEESWLAHQQHTKISATLTKQAQQNSNTKNLDVQHIKPVSQWLFWWLFFISASLIWLERKFRSSD